jgi:hypothetical protein
VGACRQGTQQCVDGAWETGCPGQVLPATEGCDPGFVDEDCDGASNEGCGCAPIDSTLACCSGRGVQTCLATAGGSAYSACSVAAATEVCNGIDDDCDGSTDEEVPPLCVAGATCVAGACRCIGGAAVLRCYVDADGDGWTPSRAVLSEQCPDSGRPQFGNCPAGFVAPGTSFVPDCDDGDPAVFVSSSVRTDLDGDGSCTGPPIQICGGATAPTGQAFASMCRVADDCDDADRLRFRIAQVRADADGDLHCVGPAVTTCIGVQPPIGQQLAGVCTGEDCRDTNGQATSVCYMAQAYRTSTVTATCGVGQPATQTLFPSVSVSCPFRFVLVPTSVSVQRLAGTGTCSALDASTIRVTCNLLDGATCLIVGDCQAL